MSWKTGSNRRRDTGKRVKFLDTRDYDKSMLPQDLVAVGGTRRIRDGETLIHPDDYVLTEDERALAEEIADAISDVIEKREEGDDESLSSGGAFGSASPLAGEQPLAKGRTSQRSSSSPLGRGSPLTRSSPLSPKKRKK